MIATVQRQNKPSKRYHSFFGISALRRPIVAEQYKEPFVKEDKISISPELIGLWKEKKKNQYNEIVILKFSDTEYLIHQITDKGTLYYRGYPINIAGIPFIQLQTIGLKKTSLKMSPYPTPYLAISYKLANDELEMKMINPKLIPPELSTTLDLKKTFLKHQKNKELFIEPEIFIRR